MALCPKKSKHEINSLYALQCFYSAVLTPWFLLWQLAKYFRKLEQSNIPKITIFQELFERFDSLGGTIVVLVKSALNSVCCCHWSIFRHLRTDQSKRVLFMDLGWSESRSIT